METIPELVQQSKSAGELKNGVFALKTGAPTVFSRPRVEIMLGEEPEEELDIFYEDSKKFLQPFFGESYTDFLLCSLERVSECRPEGKIQDLYRCVVEKDHRVEYDMQNRLDGFWNGLTALKLFCDYSPRENAFVLGSQSRKSRMLFDILAFFFHGSWSRLLPFSPDISDQRNYALFVSYTRCAFVVLKLLAGDCKPEFLHYITLTEDAHRNSVSSYFILYQVRISNHLMSLREKRLREEELEEYLPFRPPTPETKYYTPLNKEEEEEKELRGKRLRFSSAHQRRDIFE